MKIVTDRLEYVELELSHIASLTHIARDMAWNDTLLMLWDDHKTEGLRKCNPDLLQYREKVIKAVEKVFGKSYKNLLPDETRSLYQKLSPKLIPEKHWHINFSQLKPDFALSALEFVKGAQKRANSENRRGFWLGIKDKASGKIIGATTISAVSLSKDGKSAIGHSGQFIAPEFQRRGYITETKGVMVDFLYKIADLKIVSMPENAEFFTTCHMLNEGSQRLQAKSGATPNAEIDENYKMHFFATREQIMHSQIMQKKAPWCAVMDDGRKIFSDDYSQPKNRPIMRWTEPVAAQQRA